MRVFLEAKAKEENLGNPGEVVVSLIAEAIRSQKRKELEKSLIEAMDEWDHGECAEVDSDFWKKVRGDYVRKHSKA